MEGRLSLRTIPCAMATEAHSQCQELGKLLLKERLLGFSVSILRRTFGLTQHKNETRKLQTLVGSFLLPREACLSTRGRSPRAMILLDTLPAPIHLPRVEPGWGGDTSLHATTSSAAFYGE